MIAPRGMYIRNIAYIPPNPHDIRNADMIELSKILVGGLSIDLIWREQS